MTCGIYCLVFTGTNKVYIGQSRCIEKRYSQHLAAFRNGTASPKLQQAYMQHGEPALNILTECLVEELDDLEDEAIQVWDSVVNGYNTYTYANQAPTNSGYGGGHTKYTKQQILYVFDLLVNTNLSYKQIEKISGVLESTVSNISALKSHTWLKSEYFDQYILLESKRYLRKEYAKNSVSEKLSAKSRGIVYPKIKDPEGNIYNIDNAYKFAKEHGLAPNHFQEVLNGHRKSHKGWRLCPKEAQ